MNSFKLKLNLIAILALLALSACASNNQTPSTPSTPHMVNTYVCKDGKCANKLIHYDEDIHGQRLGECGMNNTNGLNC